MSEKIVGTRDEGGSQGTAASRLLSTTSIWSDAPSPVPTPKPVRVAPPALVASAPVEVVTTATPVVQSRSRQWPPRKLSLALQGGGTFAAFTWGVLERLLEDDRLEVDGALHA